MRATVEGVLREVVIVGSVEDELAEIADHAGCALIETRTAAEGLARAAAQTRSQIAFVLKGGFTPQSGFVEEAGDLLLDGADFRGALLGARPTA